MFNRNESKDLKVKSMTFSLFVIEIELTDDMMYFSFLINYIYSVDK